MLRLVSSAAELVSIPKLSRRRFGVPPGGPFDLESFLLANALVGDTEALAIELDLAAGVFDVERDCTIALVGADCQVQVGDTSLPGQARIPLTAGQRLTLRPGKTGRRLYMAAAGGFHQDGEVFQAGRAFSASRSRLPKPPASLSTETIRVVEGPQADLFDLSSLLASPWRVSRLVSRMGVRLEGKLIQGPAELPSEPACAGAIQIPSSGQPIILGPDGPTIGGYPKPLVVCAADFPKIGQLRPDDEVTFRRISLDEAREAHANWQRELDARLAVIRLGVSL